MPELIAEQLLREIRSLLSSELGEFRPGVPAIALEPPQSPNTGQGLHVTIPMQPTRVRAVLQYKVKLVQYDRTDRGLEKFNGAVAKMRDRFPTATEVISPFEPDKFTQAVFTVQGYQGFVGTAI